MGTFAAGQIVVLPFPFSDLSNQKLRPALLLAEAGRGDWIACQITSNPYADPRALTLTNNEFTEGGLHRISYLRPGKIFTCHESLPVNSVGKLNQTALQQARTAMVGMIQGG
ncbi:MAG: type II toxin-antitoxin system PemK/MazF family toxin [Gammaproteobacteria bacterium]|nr:type II toxin-antitoxin system PemK/MazF family toxin [Gammaproteobacteria bacterium]MBU1775200.1 type II toxin-antitoxin system PemK/MazF family toxin [Gammaproteobacteria bacterium]MBU1968746.1 type II toxin-antitoxin system PemK/MazF family toxin [Gammaproteobacteria bacterium]